LKNKTLEEYPWFCPEPFTNIMTSIGGSPKPCCHIDTKNWQGQDIVDFRKEFLNGSRDIIDKCCVRCIKQEEVGNKSFRQNYLQKFVDRNLDIDLENPPLLTMEYKAQNNLCNLRCNMCKPILSSSFAKENLALGKPINYKMNNKSHYEEISQPVYLKDLMELKLVGGETLAIAENYQIMEQCPSDVVLSITTNGTVTPKFNGKTIFDFIPKFKEVHMNVSIEFWGEKNNYLRFPSKWQTIMKNVKKFKSYKNCIVSHHVTVNALNIGHMLEIVDNTFCPISLDNLVYGDDEIYSVVSTPPSIREKYLDNYYKNYKKEIDHIISYLEDIEYDETQMWKMLQDIKDRDKYRGTCLIDILPEWKPYYEKL